MPLVLVMTAPSAADAVALETEVRTLGTAFGRQLPPSTRCRATGDVVRIGPLPFVRRLPAGWGEGEGGLEVWDAEAWLARRTDRLAAARDVPDDPE